MLNGTQRISTSSKEVIQVMTSGTGSSIIMILEYYVASRDASEMTVSSATSIVPWQGTLGTL